MVDFFGGMELFFNTLYIIALGFSMVFMYQLILPFIGLEESAQV